VCLEETGASTPMPRSRGRAPKGQRCVASVPNGHGHTPTVIAGLRVHERTAPRVLDGPMDGEAFLRSVRQVLCPTRKPGDLVIADHRPSHQVAGGREALEAAGATWRDLPPYAPELKPLEPCFSKLKALRKKAAHRTVDARWDESGQLLDAFSPHECANDFKAAGYV
jgi:transposase